MGMLANMVGKARLYLVEKSPEILIGSGISGLVLSTILAVKATPKALMLIEQAKKENNVEKLDAVDVVKATWKCYIPVVIISGVSIACIIFANSIHLKRNAAAIAACALTETALTDYKNEVISALGQKKEREIFEESEIRQAKRMPVKEIEIIQTGKGNTLCMDYISGRYFTHNIDKIRTAVSELNSRMKTDDPYVSLNEYYMEIDLPTIGIGDDIGWNINHGEIAISPASCLTEDERPCLVIGHLVMPRPDYRGF